MEYINYYHSPLGRILLAADTCDHLTGLWFENQKYYARHLDREVTEKDLPLFQDVKHWLNLYFSGTKPDFIPPLHADGTDFQKLIWNILLTIPYGQTATYGSIARQAARELGLTHMSAQAVGNAVGHNKISILIPCHRVVGSNGSLTGYAGGLDRKRKLLTLEQVNLSPLLP